MRNERDLKAKSPYIYNMASGFLNDFSIVNYGKVTKGGVLDIGRYIFKVDVLFFNWIENTSKLQIPVFLFFFILAKAMNKKIAWTHHNIHPHKSKNGEGLFLMKYLVKNVDYIIIHTSESYKLLEKSENDNRVLYYFHPFFTKELGIGLNERKKNSDLLIWGNVRKSKGIEVFLDYLVSKNILYKFKIKIVGKFQSEAYYLDFIKRFEAPNIVIENKFIDDIELDELHGEAKYVFFPYTGSSVLNSGALIKSLPKGVPIIGPNVGAFKELGDRKIIHIYNNFDDVIDLIENEDKIKIDSVAVRELVSKNTWIGFSEFIKKSLQ